MKKIIRIIVIVLVFLFVIFQFIRPEKNFSAETQNHLFNQVAVQAEVREILKNACLDCHSDQTRYFWYDQISPVSWTVKSHITEGKKELNFSQWGRLTPVDQISLLGKIIDEAKSKKMPLKSYSFVHKQARLSDGQIKTLNNWAETYGMEIYQKK